MAGETQVESFYSMCKVRDIIEEAINNPLEHSNRTLFIEGPPGIGKTALAKSLYRQYQRSDKNPKGFTRFIDFVSPEHEPTEFGLPMPNRANGTIDMMPLTEFKFDPNDRIFMLIDEIDKANNMMQNVLARIAHEHAVHNVVLPGSFPYPSFVLMAGNRLIDRAGGFSANSHIKGRRTRVPAGVDHVEWIENVALPMGLHSSVVSFIRASPGNLHKFDANAPSFPSPRSWTKVGEQLNHVLPESLAHVERAMIEGDIGVESANAFWGHLRIHRDLRDPQTIIKDPARAAIPTGANAPAIMWAEVTALARYAEPENADAIFRYFNRLDGEYSFCGYKDVLFRDKADGKDRVKKAKSAQKWMMDNATTLQATRAL